MKLSIDNSHSQLVGLPFALHQELSAELSSEEEAFGYVYLSLKQISKLQERQGKVFYRDCRGIPRPVLNRRFKPFACVKDVRATIEKLDYAMARGYIVKRTTLLGKRGEFPSGLLGRVRTWIKQKALVIPVADHRVRPRSTPEMFKLRGFPKPYDAQVSAAIAAMKSERGAVVMPTGSGKSVTMCLLIDKLQCRTLVVVPNLALKKQLSETFIKYFGSLANIAVENIDSPRLPKLTDFDALILDESHHAAASTYRKLNKSAWKKIFFRFYFTATPFRSREAEAIVLESVIGKIIYRLSYADAVKHGYICPVEAFYFKCPEKDVAELKTWPGVYSALIVKNDARNDLITMILKNTHASGTSSLCLVKEIAHGETLSQASGAAFAHGQAEDTEDLLSWFADGKLKTLIATTGIAGEGVDSRAAEYAIICGGGKSRNAFVQQVGRVLRRFSSKESGKVFLFKDESHPWLAEHFTEQVRFLKEEFDVTPIELPWITNEEAA